MEPRVRVAVRLKPWEIGVRICMVCFNGAASESRGETMLSRSLAQTLGASMEPRVRVAVRQQRIDRRRRQRFGFNGAASESRGETPAQPLREVAGPGFNGAASESRGETTGLPSGLGRGLGFNGAASESRGETLFSFVPGSEASKASMEPRVRVAVRPRGVNFELYKLEASMEPRVRVAVRQILGGGQLPPGSASMEPRVRVAVRPDSNQSEGVLWSASMEPRVRVAVRQLKPNKDKKARKAKSFNGAASESRGETWLPFAGTLPILS